MSLLARLIESGTPAALIEEVAMLLAEKKISDAAIADRRAKDRSRQERKRSRDEVECHVTERDISNGAFPAPPNENNLTPPTHTPVYKTPRARRLPADWVPAPLPSQLLDQVSAWKAGLLESELAKFRDWAAAAPDKTGLKKDWDAAWRNWLRRKSEEGSGNGTANRTGSQNGAPRDGFTAVLRDVGSRENAFIPAGDDGGMRTTSPVGLIASC